MDRLILDASNVSKSYGDAQVLRSFDVRLTAGEIHGLLGPNGSGKSTSLHILTGLLSASSGDVRIDGIPVASKSSRHRLGFAPDDLPLPEMLTGREYIRFHDALRAAPAGVIAEELFDVLGMRGALDRTIGTYSHGMKRKIQLIAALSHQPSLLVLDEPFRGLDPDAAAILRVLISEFAKSGRSVLMATHDMIRAERDCDSVTILSAGVIVAQGAPHRLIEESAVSNLEEVFLWRTGLAESTAKRSEILADLFDVA